MSDFKHETEINLPGSIDLSAESKWQEGLSGRLCPICLEDFKEGEKALKCEDARFRHLACVGYYRDSMREGIVDKHVEAFIEGIFDDN